MGFIPDRLLAQMTEEELQVYRDAQAGWPFQPTFTCPHCCAEVRVKLKVSFGGVAADRREKPPPAVAVAQPGNAKEFKLLREAKETGMYDAFVKATQEEKAGEVPGDLDKFFLDFFRLAAVIKVPIATLDRYRAEYPDQQIAFFQAQGVIAVTADGLIKEFTPYRYARSQKTRLGTLPHGFRPPEEQLDIWVRGKFGYVPRDAGAFADALRQPSVGAFGRVVQ